MRLAITGPQVLDELLVRIAAEKAAPKPASTVYRLTLHRIVGSMMEKLQMPAGSVVGKVMTEQGVPVEIQLGPALLPSEIGITRAKADPPTGEAF